MKVRITESERWPTYFVTDSIHGMEVEATPEQVERWRAATEAFDAAQDEMSELHEAAASVEMERQAREQAEREAKKKAEREVARQLATEARRKREAAVARLLGTVYDADGNPVGQVEESHAGLQVRPIAVQ